MTKAQDDKAFDLYESHANSFDDNYLSKGRSPRNHIWRPYRFATRDVPIGLVVVKHNQRDNLLETDVCLTYTPKIFEDYEAERIMLSFLLSEAFKCGGSMEIRFSKNVEGGRVPARLCDFAIVNEVKLNPDHVFKGVITPTESRKLYMAATKLSNEAITRVMELAVNDRLSPERVCYMIHNGIWSLQEMEIILLGTERPEAVLHGTYSPEMRHLHLESLNVAKGALLGAYMDRRVRKRPFDSKDDSIEELEGDEIRVENSFDPEHFANIYVANESYPVPWVVGQNPPRVRKNWELNVLLRARTKAEILVTVSEDLKNAKNASKDSERSMTMILYSHDYSELSEAKRKGIEERALKANIIIGCCPIAASTLAREAADKLRNCKVLREGL